MTYRLSQATMVAVLATAGWLAMAASGHAQGYGAPGWASPEPNYYAQPAGDEGLTAAMYPSPRPTPPLVGQTYITYEALAPHEFLYLHHHWYKTRNEGGQVTRTSVTYGHRLNVLHPDLRHAVPALHTPDSPGRR